MTEYPDRREKSLQEDYLLESFMADVRPRKEPLINNAIRTIRVERGILEIPEGVDHNSLVSVIGGAQEVKIKSIDHNSGVFISRGAVDIKNIDHESFCVFGLEVSTVKIGSLDHKSRVVIAEGAQLTIENIYHNGQVIKYQPDPDNLDQFERLCGDELEQLKSRRTEKDTALDTSPQVF